MLSPPTQLVHLREGPHAVVADGELLFIYPTHLEALDKAADLESVGCIVSVIPSCADLPAPVAAQPATEET